MVVTEAEGGGQGMGSCWLKGTKFYLDGMNTFQRSMYSMMTIINNNALEYQNITKGTDLKYSHNNNDKYLR